MIYLFSSLWLSHRVSVGFNFIVIAPLLPSCLSLEGIFFRTFQHFFFFRSMVVHQLVVVFMLL